MMCYFFCKASNEGSSFLLIYQDYTDHSPKTSFPWLKFHILNINPYKPIHSQML